MIVPIIFIVFLLALVFVLSVSTIYTDQITQQCKKYSHVNFQNITGGSFSPIKVPNDQIENFNNQQACLRLNGLPSYNNYTDTHTEAEFFFKAKIPTGGEE